jgi:hypothetical protein
MPYSSRTILLIAIIVLLTFGGCTMTFIEGSGVPASETRDVTDFDSVSFAGAGKVTITQGEETSVTVEADDNLLPLVKTEVDGKTLKVYEKKDFGTSLRFKNQLKVNITVKDLRSISVAGSADVVAEDFDSEDFSVSIAGSGDVKLSGKAKELAISIAGSGDCDLKDFAVETADIAISGSGSAVVSVEKELEVNIAGSGDVIYHGEPKVEQSIMGSGSIRPAK